MANAHTSHSAVRVLLVDDFEPFRRTVRSILARQPELQVVGEAADGFEAFQKAEALNPDLILLDIGLPSLNGIEVANRLCSSGAKVLFVTGNNDADVVRAALSNGAKGYVLKVDAGSELLLAIKAILRGEKFVSSGTKRDGF